MSGYPGACSSYSYGTEALAALSLSAVLWGGVSGKGHQMRRERIMDSASSMRLTSMCLTSEQIIGLLSVGACCFVRANADLRRNGRNIIRLPGNRPGIL